MLEINTCTETVSILYALVFGADGACISLGLGSLFAAFAVFIAGVVLLQVVARRLLARAMAGPKDPPQAPDQAQGYQPPPYESPIRKSRF